MVWEHKNVKEEFLTSSNNVAKCQANCEGFFIDLNMLFGCGKAEILRYQRLFEIFRNSLCEAVNVEVI